MVAGIKMQISLLETEPLSSNSASSTQLFYSASEPFKGLISSNKNINSVRTSQETHNVSTTKPNRLMLLQETVAVYCENHM
jgi:hypothetical protein